MAAALAQEPVLARLSERFLSGLPFLPPRPSRFILIAHLYCPLVIFTQKTAKITSSKNLKTYDTRLINSKYAVPLSAEGVFVEQFLSRCDKNAFPFEVGQDCASKKRTLGSSFQFNLEPWGAGTVVMGEERSLAEKEDG